MNAGEYLSANGKNPLALCLSRGVHSENKLPSHTGTTKSSPYARIRPGGSGSDDARIATELRPK